MRGLGKGFAPSASAAAAAMPGLKIRQEPHPPGVKGTTFSLKEMGKFIRDGRNDPRVRAWAGRILMKAGKPASATAQAQAILDEIRRVTIYVQDPVGSEFMAKPAATLCLDEHGLCIPAADCDDRCIAFGSATMSVGIETLVVGCAYGTEQATHVMCTIYDPDTGWQMVDPSTDFPVGKSYPATKCWYLDVVTGGMSMTAEGAMAAGAKQEAVSGDFIGVGSVGMGAIPFEHAFGGVDEGCEQGPAYVSADLTHGSCPPPVPVYSHVGMGAIPFEHAFGGVDEGCEQGPAYVSADLTHGSCITAPVLPYAWNSKLSAFVGAGSKPSSSPGTSGEWVPSGTGWFWAPLPVGQWQMFNGVVVTYSPSLPTAPTGLPQGLRGFPGTWVQTLPGYYVWNPLYTNGLVEG